MIIVHGVVEIFCFYEMEKDNKKIIINTIVMYARLIITTIIGLLSSRFVLQALGASDFGLYAVVGGVISMLGVINTAMHTTTRRYINVEMGKLDRNMNRIFNISRLLHFGFALFIFIIAETIGMFYIYNYLNVDSGKLSDAIFVFQVSTIAAAISIINVPYQALLQAFEKFTQVAIFDIISYASKLLFVVSLLFVEGNVLRIYAIGMSCLTLFSLLFYNVACKIQWNDIIRYKYYRGIKTYKEILYFNNYVVLGATSYLSRTQGSNILVNYFFGTLVNAAFSIGYTIENFCMMFVSNIGSAATPQIAKNYENNNDRSVFLTEVLNKTSIYLMLLIVVPLSLEMDFVLNLWLKDVPKGATLICQFTLISALVRTLFGGLDKLIQASGKIRWFQVVGSIVEISCLPISFVLFQLGLPSYTVIVVYIIMTVVNAFIGYVMMREILNFDVMSYAKRVLFPATWVIMILLLFAYVYYWLTFESYIWHVVGVLTCFIVTLLTVFFVGLNKCEKQYAMQLLYNKIIKK